MDGFEFILLTISNWDPPQEFYATSLLSFYLRIQVFQMTPFLLDCIIS